MNDARAVVLDCSALKNHQIKDNDDDDDDDLLRRVNCIAETQLGIMQSLTVCQ